MKHCIFLFQLYIISCQLRILKLLLQANFQIMSRSQNFLKNFILFAGNYTLDQASNFQANMAFIGAVFHAVCQVVAHPRRVHWRETIYYMNLCGCQSLPVVGSITLAMGLIIGFQASIQMQRFGTDLMVADLVAFSTLKTLGPLMVAIISTGRAGSAFAAEIATMKCNDEISALSTMAINPYSFLVIPKFIAMLAMLPLLTILGDAFGLLGGLIVGVFMLDIPVETYITRTNEVIEPGIFLFGVLKSYAFAILITLIGCAKGFLAETTALGVGRATTKAVVDGIFVLVLADGFITLIYWFFGV